MAINIELKIAMTSYPYWVTTSDLGSFQEGYSFISNPLSIDFGETLNLPCVVSLLNGNLPTGVRWQQDGFSVTLLGNVHGISTDTTFTFTFRITNGSFVSDQTFYIKITNTIDILEWITDYIQPVGYYYSSGIATYIVSAKNTPTKAIEYSIAPNTTRGLSIEKTSGLISLDLTWKSNTTYIGGTDYVINNNNLYICVITGQSGLSIGPTSTGLGVVDSTYPVWRPNTPYSLNVVVTNDSGKIYVCIVSGISAPGGGPTGTGTSVSDGAVVKWQYIGQAAVWDQIAVGTLQNLPFSAIATTSTKSIIAVFSISLVSRPYQPIWITPSGILEENLPPGELFSYKLQVLEPDFLVVTFSSNNLPSWLSLTNSGELWGKIPAVQQTTSYSFTVVATANSISVPRSFVIVVFENDSQLVWNTDSDLGTVEDGDFSTLQIFAKTFRLGKFVSYGVSSGMLPPNLTLIYDSGILDGFIDYHAIDKTYYFEVTATDGVDSITKVFSLKVQAKNIGPHMNLSIPLMGVDKIFFNVNNSNSLIDESYLFQSANPHKGRNKYPEIPLITGFKSSNADDLRNLIASWLHEFVVNYTTLGVTNDQTLPYQELFIRVRDADSVGQWQPNTFYQTGERVSNGDGLEFVAIYGGTSGNYPGPVTKDSKILDGTITWTYESVPNNSVSTPHTLPWYPRHLYSEGQTVTNNGDIYQAQNSGYSAGDLGPFGQQSVVDGDVVWNWIRSNIDSPNIYYPSNIFNIRNSIKTASGFATAQGAGASAIVYVDPTTNGIGHITINNKGTGYYRAPYVNIFGSGYGAELAAKLSINSGTITFSTVGFVVGQQFNVDQGLGTSAIISVATVNSFGQVTKISIISGGTYTVFPQAAVTFVSGTQNFSVLFDLGVGSVDVVYPGNNYTVNATSINFNGRELIPDWLENLYKGYATCIRLADITANGSSEFIANTFIDNTFYGEKIEVKYIKLSQNGVSWTGTTTFDDNEQNFDCDTTRFVEIDESSQTIFDMNTTLFENKSTYFDGFTNTTVGSSDFESNFILDNNETIIDQPSMISNSKYSIQWLIALGKPFQ